MTVARLLEILSFLAAVTLCYCAWQFVTSEKIDTVYEIGLIVSGISIAAIAALYFTVVKRV